MKKFVAVLLFVSILEVSASSSYSFEAFGCFDGG
jgi:hypothetical protein